MPSDDPPLNPYAPPALCESPQQPNRQVLPVPIVARGRITLSDRKYGLQMMAWVTPADWRSYFLRVAAILLVFLATGEFEVLVVVAAVALLPTIMKLLRMRWASVSARKAEQQELIVERVIDDRGIAAAGQALTTWSAYYTGRVGQTLIVLVIGRYEAYQVFPRRHFASDGDWAAFEKAVREYVWSVK